MGKLIFVIFAAVSLLFMVSSASAQILFASQPNGVYNLGDMVSVPVTVSATSASNGPFYAYLVCGYKNTLVYQEYLSLSASDKSSISILSPPLNSTLVGGTSGSCHFKTVFGGTYQASNQFNVSNMINVKAYPSSSQFKPGQQISVTGSAVREDGQGSNGMAYLTIYLNNNSVYRASSKVNSGSFNFSFSLPKDTQAGQYYSRVTINETSLSGVPTNAGYSAFSLNVEQVPTNLELISPKSIDSGKTLRVEAILHDQTGVNINSPVQFNITNEEGKITDQVSSETDNFINVPISYDTPQGTWTVSASSGGLKASSNLEISETERIIANFVNKTLVVTNVGNVPYNHTVSVDVGGNKSMGFNVSLAVGQSQKYIVSAPDGDYHVSVSSEGANLFNGNVALTGNAINVYQASSSIGSLLRYPLIWISLIFILGFTLFTVSKKYYKKSFFGEVNLSKLRPSGKKEPLSEEVPEKKDSLIKDANKASISLSIQGDKQESLVVCLNLKNFDEIKSGKGGIDETMKNIAHMAESSRAVIYEDGGYVFVIFAPVKTKTFKNERSAVAFARDLKEELDNHNKMFKQNINFGISVNCGKIVAKHFGKGLKFMSLGSFSSLAKKLSALSNGEVVLSNEIHDRLMSEIKTEKKSKGDFDYYILTNVRDRTKNEKFLKDFMKKLESERREKREKEKKD